MKNDKFLIELISHLSNRPLLFFLVWGVIVVFFLYLFWSLQKSNNKRYFREDSEQPRKNNSGIQIAKKENKTDLTKKD